MRFRGISRLLGTAIVLLILLIYLLNSYTTENREKNEDFTLKEIIPSTIKVRVSDKPVISPTRKFTQRLVVKPLENNSNNDSLSKLANNMTVLKANHSHLHSFIKGINETLDESEIRNPHPFKYIINSQSTCQVDNLFLLVYVHTAIKHVKQRMVIRQTWGNPKQYDLKIRVVFVLGKSVADKNVQEALLYEAQMYNDIVQEDFVDAYKNLTYKGVAALKWVTNHCRNAKYVLKADDDMFVNMFTLLRHLSSYYRFGTYRNDLILCLVWGRMIVMRSGKWAVSEKEFPGKYYPTYCSGSAFTLSTDVAVKLYYASYTVPFFWVDDFYITGLLPLKLKLKHKQFMSTYVLDGRKLEEKFNGPQWYTYVFSHVHDLSAIQRVWKSLIKLANGEIQPKIKYIQVNSSVTAS